MLNISSLAAVYALDGLHPYCVTKATLAMIQQCLTKELANEQILFNSVMPGVTATDML